MTRREDVLENYLETFQQYVSQNILPSLHLLTHCSRNIPLINRERIISQIYKTPIRTHIEYSTQAWTPVSRHENWSIILKLEGIQRRVTKIIKILLLQGEIGEIMINYFTRKNES